MERRQTKKTTGKRALFGRKSDTRDFKRGDNFLREGRKRFCKFCQEKINYIDYKDITRLSRFISDRKKILSRRFSGNCAKHQRKLSHAVKRARFIALL